MILNKNQWKGLFPLAKVSNPIKNATLASASGVLMAGVGTSLSL